MKLYRVFAYLMAVEVLVQVAALTFAMFSLGGWIDDGGVARKDTVEGDGVSFPGKAAFDLPGVNGTLWIPLLSLAFLVVAVVTRRSVVGGVRWAAIVLGLVVLQVTLGFVSLAVPQVGPLHGLNAFALFVTAVHAARRVGAASPVPQLEPATV
jgi:heme A synthase